MPSVSRRTDASRNREAILRAADEAFSGSEGALSLVEIARRTGLGRATVYRHFPNRNALAAAFSARQLRMLREAVEAPGAQDRPFLDVMNEVLAVLIARPALVELLAAAPRREQELHVRALAGVLAPVLRRGQAAGEVRPELLPEDMEYMLTMVQAAITRAGHDGPDPPEVIGRLVTVMLDGMAAAPERRLQS
jgi:AcrR family transcriptional regulator